MAECGKDANLTRFTEVAEVVQGQLLAVVSFGRIFRYIAGRYIERHSWLELCPGLQKSSHTMRSHVSLPTTYATDRLGLATSPTPALDLAHRSMGARYRRIYKLRSLSTFGTGLPK